MCAVLTYKDSMCIFLETLALVYLSIRSYEFF